jgi:hypothetical protein
MGFVYFLIGILLPITILQIVKLYRKGVFKRKIRKPVDQTEVKQLRAEFGELRTIVKELHDDMKHLQEVNNETQKRNELLFPQNFDKDKSDGKTVFVKNGEEKPYETVDWRSR